MTTTLWITVAILALDAILVAALLVWRLCVPSAISSIPEIGPLLVAAGVLTALIAFLLNLRRARSEDFLKASTEMLEKAFEMLAPEENALEPTNNRLSWLSAARLVARPRSSQLISQKIVMSLFTKKRKNIGELASTS